MLAFSLSVQANDIDSLNSKIIKSGVGIKVSKNINNQDLEKFCAKQGQIRQYEGIFCETSSRIAAFILLVCQSREDFQPSHCHYKAGRKFARANQKDYPKTYEIYKKIFAQSIEKPFLEINENDQAIAKEIKNLVAEAFSKYYHGALCNLLAQSLQARQKKWPAIFMDNICTTEYRNIFPREYPSIIE